MFLFNRAKQTFKHRFPLGHFASNSRTINQFSSFPFSPEKCIKMTFPRNKPEIASAFIPWFHRDVSPQWTPPGLFSCLGKSLWLHSEGCKWTTGKRPLTRLDRPKRKCPALLRTNPDSWNLQPLGFENLKCLIF